MRIKGSDLRRIIKEEVRRATLREQSDDMFGLEDESEAEAKLSRIMRRPEDVIGAVDLSDPTASASMPRTMSRPTSSSPMSAIIDTLRQNQATDAEINEVESMLPRIIDGLDKVYNGDLVVKMGDRGPLVKALQILVRSSISDFLDFVTPQTRSIYLRDFANSAIDALSSAYAMTPDGVYDSDTSDAVKAIQKAMNVVYRLHLLSGGGPVEKIMQNPAKIDGRIGRQTLQFLMGRVGATISKSPVQDIADKSLLVRALRDMGPDDIVRKLLGPDPAPEASAELVAAAMGEDKIGAAALLDLIRNGRLDANFEGMSMEELQAILDSLPKYDMAPTGGGPQLKPSNAPRDDIKVDMPRLTPPPPVTLPDVNMPIRLPESRRRR